MGSAIVRRARAALGATALFAVLATLLGLATARAADLTCGNVGAHASHTRDSRVRAALACDACHGQVCSSAAAPNIVFSDLASAGGLLPSWNPLDRTCSNVACHGTSLLPLVWTYVDPTAVRPPEVECALCHGYPPPSPHPQMTGCQGCHSSTVAAGGSIDLTGGRHINGALDFSPDFSGGSFSHAATPGIGAVVVFPDTGHDDAGWRGTPPYFSVPVDCTLCHNTELAVIHGNHCATCHPSPFDTLLGTWHGGCQQGGCHASYHEASATAHAPFEDPQDPANDCSRCHAGSQVSQARCMNCHAAYAPTDTTPPLTTSNALASYVGPAKIEFSITDNGKVGVGRTFYRLDGGATEAAGKALFVAAPGSHTLEFWSRDQSGNEESASRSAAFTIAPDTAPPTTISNVQSTYSQSAMITLTAADNSTLGVKRTYYRLDGGPIQIGTLVQIPGTTGVIAYVLNFWSEDWSGNVEEQKTANFTVSSGAGVLRLVWGASDVYGSPCPGDPEANAAWTIRRGGPSGPVVATGLGSCPGWPGVDDVAVPVGSTSYHVIVDWWDSYYGYDEQTVFPNVSVTTPGQIVRLGY